MPLGIDPNQLKEANSSSSSISSISITQERGTETQNQQDSNSSEVILSKTLSKTATTIGIDQGKLKTFLIMLAKAAKRHEIRSAARQEFHEHLDTIKENLSTKRNYASSHLDNDLDALKRKVEHLISVEKDTSRHVQEKSLAEKLSVLESKLNMLMASKIAKDQRFEQLERKITSKLDVDKQLIESLERKLLMLQRKLIEKKLATRGKKKPSTDLDAIKTQIDKTKQVITKLKGDVVQ